MTRFLRHTPSKDLLFPDSAHISLTEKKKQILRLLRMTILCCNKYFRFYVDIAYCSASGFNDCSEQLDTGRAPAYFDFVT